MNYQRDILNLYDSILEEQAMVEEGKSGHGDTAVIKKLLKKAIKMGLVSVEDTTKGFMVKSLVDDTQQLFHRGEKAFHPLRRYLRQLQKVAS